MAEREYERLTRADVRGGVQAFASIRTSLWLGSDHLLCIDSTGYTETYKRFHFRDIQAIVMVASNRRLIWNWVLAAFSVLGLAILLTAFFSPGGGAIGGIIAGGFILVFSGVPLLINNLLGPTCTCYLRTAVQIEELGSVARFRRAQKILDRLHPLIVAAQGELAPEEIPERLRQLAQSAAAPEPQRYVSDDPNAPPRILP